MKFWRIVRVQEMLNYGYNHPHLVSQFFRI